MISSDIDIDRWGYGRNPNGKMDTKYLKASYQHIEFNKHEEWEKIRKIIEENLEYDNSGLRPYLTVGPYVFFLSKADRDLVQTLRLIY